MLQTELLQADDAGINRAAKLLKNGGLVAIPTETVYGLAADALNGPAVAKIFSAKGRPQDNPLIVHIAAWNQLADLVSEIPPQAEALAEKYWPGPLTVILPKSSKIPHEVSAGLNTVAVRFPSHPVARRVIQAAGTPLAAPSANLSGSPSPTCAAHVLDDMRGRIHAVLNGGDCEVGVESTVITLAERRPRLLRPGGITLEQLQTVLGEVAVDPAVLDRLAEGQKASSPGMKYKHYAPRAHVVLVKGSAEKYAAFLNMQQDKKVYAMCFDEDIPLLRVPFLSYGAKEDAARQAHSLFYDLRTLDDMGASTVYVHCPALNGVGLAVYNRLIRAAAFEIVEL